MAVSGSTDFNLVTNEIIEEACDLCGIGSEGEAISADIYARATRSLNLIVKAWSAGDHLWLRTQRSVTLVANQNSYALTPKPGRVVEVRRRNIASQIDVPLMQWSQEEYLAQPNKSVASIPTAFYYNPQATAGTLYVWPAPSTSTASDFELQITYLRKIQDFDNSNDDADLPQEWLQALTYALAEQLAIKYMPNNPALVQMLTERAAMYKAHLDSWDTEPASLYLQPDYRA